MVRGSKSLLDVIYGPQFCHCLSYSLLDGSALLLLMDLSVLLIEKSEREGKAHSTGPVKYSW